MHRPHIVNFEGKHELSQDYYTIEILSQLVAQAPHISLSPHIKSQIECGESFLKAAVAREAKIYGVNTGFGALYDIAIPKSQFSQLQVNLLRSHACGVGVTIPSKIVQYIFLLKLLSFRHGFSGVSLGLVQRLVHFWNDQILPVIPSKGSLGASGDLAPLAHFSLPLIGEGEVLYRGKRVKAKSVLRRLRLQPLQLQPKEGLALINGVQFINAIGVSEVSRSLLLSKFADLVASLSIQAYACSDGFYSYALLETSLHPERGIIISNLQRILKESNHANLSLGENVGQDPYSFRCIPQVHAAVRQALQFSKEIVERECNSCSDNPILIPEHDAVLSCGNIHGESTSMALDFLAIAVSELASISERRIYQLLSGNRGLPDFLVKSAGLNSGFMVAQSTAAALVNENKILCTPASVDTILTSQLQEDHVSMGGTAALKLMQIVSNCEIIIAIELIIAAQATELRDNLRLSPSTRWVLDEFRNHVMFLEHDRMLSEDIEKACEFIRNNGPAFVEKLGLC